MSKVLLIIYMLGGGQTTVYNPHFNFQEFQTVDQCEVAVQRMEKLVSVWHIGDDKENKIPALYSTECWEVPGYKEEYKNDPTRYLKVQAETPKPKIEIDERTNRRWNDL